MLETVQNIGRVLHVSEVSDTYTKELPVRSEDHLSGDVASWQELLLGKKELSIPAETTKRIIVDLGTYYCVYPELVTSGGKDGRVCIRLDESLRLEPKTLHGRKGNRDEIENKYFAGGGDTYMPDGGVDRHFMPLWWLGGRYMEIVAEASSEPLIIKRLRLRETRYPMEMQSIFVCNDPRFEYINRISLRCLQVDEHEVYIDWPYEQMMFIGDTRIQALINYTVTYDDRLTRKAIRLLQASQRPDGITQSRYPNRNTQIIPGYSLWWIGMLYDYAMWRGDKAFVAEMMTGARSIIDFFLNYRNHDGLIEALPWWNYIDVTTADLWEGSIPPDAETGVSAVVNWQFVLALRYAAELEIWLGELELAQRDRRLAQEISTQLQKKFWNQERALYADNLAGTSFSEHTQILALLSGRLPATQQHQVAQQLVADPDLARTSFYFMHYLFDAYAITGQIDALFKVLDFWYERYQKDSA
jgi:hypothetical protein